MPAKWAVPAASATIWVKIQLLSGPALGAIHFEAIGVPVVSRIP